MLTFDPSRWGTLAGLHENALSHILTSVDAHVVRGICRDGRMVVNERASCERNARAREAIDAEDVEESWEAYEVVCGMVERAVRTSDSCTVTVKGNINDLSQMLSEAFWPKWGYYEFKPNSRRYNIVPWAQEVLDPEDWPLSSGIKLITAYPNFYTGSFVFPGVIIFSSTDATGYITLVAHYELQFLYNIGKIQLGLIKRWTGPDHICWIDLPVAMEQILDLYLQYNKNPNGMLCMKMSLMVVEIIPKMPAITSAYYKDFQIGDPLNRLGYIEEDRVPLDAYMAYVQCVVGEDPMGVDMYEIRQADWNGYYLGYAVFWEGGPVFCFLKKLCGITVFRTPQFPSVAPWAFRTAFS
jgi:hypothetical protein